MFLEEPFECLLVQSVVHIGVPFESWLEESCVSPACAAGVLLVALVVVRQTGKLATLPAEVALVPGHVQGTKEEKAIGDQRKLVDISQLDRVLSLDHVGRSLLTFFYN